MIHFPVYASGLPPLPIEPTPLDAAAPMPPTSRLQLTGMGWPLTLALGMIRFSLSWGWDQHVETPEHQQQGRMLQTGAEGVI